MNSGGSRYRHHAVSTAYLAAAQMNGRGYDPVRMQQMDGKAHAGHICYCIQ